MSIKRVEKIDDVVVVELEGRLDVHISANVEVDIHNIIQKGTLKLILNLKKLKHLSSSGLRLFITTKREIESLNGKLALCNIHKYAKEVLDIVDLTKQFTIYKDEESALEAFGIKNIK